MVEKVLFTKPGYERLSQELTNLKSFERPKIIQEIATARAHGDLKENAEYHAAREKQSFIEGRISILDDLIARAEVVEVESGRGSELVKFGTFVTLTNEDTGETKTYQIVGDIEADIDQNRISLSSPLTKALLGKKSDDLVEVRAPKGVISYVISEIH